MRLASANIQPATSVPERQEFFVSTSKSLTTVKRELPATLEELGAFVLIGKEKINAYRAKLRAVKKVGLAKAVRDQTIGEGQTLSEQFLYAEVRLGELLKARNGNFVESKRQNSGRGRPRELPDGIDHKDAYEFYLIAAHADLIPRALAEATEREDIATRRDLLRLIRTELKGAPQPFDPQAFNVWSFGNRNPAFGIEYPGNIPGDIIQNLLWLYTEENSVVIDPFAGGGVTHDVCRWWSDSMWPVLCASFDAQPRRPEIIQHDITTGFPASAQNASLIFLDPPYWKQKRGDYAGGVNLADLSLSEFNATLEKIIQAGMARLIPGGRLALLIGATRDGQRHDHAAEMLFRLHDLELEERAIVTYSTQQAAPYHISAAKNGKFLLNRYRDLMIWKRRILNRSETNTLYRTLDAS